MTRIDNLAAAFFGNKRLENSSSGTITQTRTETGIATSDSADGLVSVIIGDETIPGTSLDETEIGTNAVTIPTTVAVKSGDVVIVTLVGNDRIKSPTVTGVIGRGDEQETAISEAETAAAEAYAAVETQEEHFWNDANGVHVATEAGDADNGPNLLANSQGVLLRIADKIRTAMTSSGFAIYDGLGNAAANIIAMFGATVTIGQAGKAQLILSALGFNFKNPFGDTYFVAGLKSSSSNTTYFAFGQPPSGATYGDHSFAAGDGSQAGNSSVAIGPYNTASNGTAIGDNSTADNSGIAIGHLAEADNGVSLGYGTIANTGNVAVGHWNVADTNQDYSVIYGNGTSASARSNGYMIDQSGHIVDPAGGTTLKEYVLFDNSANGGTLATTGGTLSSSLVNFSRVKIFFHSDVYTTIYSSTEALIFSAQTNRVNLATNFGQSNGSSVYYNNMVYCPIYLSGTTWFVSSSAEYGHAYFGSDGSKAVNHNCNIRVDKILGYK